MKISARNTLVGKIVEIHEGPVSTEVTIETAAGEKIVSAITTTSAKNLGLKGGGRLLQRAIRVALPARAPVDEQYLHDRLLFL